MEKRELLLRLFKETKAALFYFLQAMILALVIVNFIGRISVVHGKSMEPELCPGERIVVNLFAFRLREPQRFEVVIFKYPREPSKDYIKRVVGLPGECLEIKRGIVFINGSRLFEPYPVNRDDRDFGPVRIPAGCVFVLGDNRANSEDSRSWGCVPLELVRGKADFIIWPFQQIGHLR